MLTQKTLEDLLNSAREELKRVNFGGINRKMFQSVTPDLHWEAEDVRAAAEFIRAAGLSARAICLYFDDHTVITDYVLLIGRTEPDLTAGTETIRESVANIEGASFIDLDSGEVTT